MLGTPGGKSAPKREPALSPVGLAAIPYAVHGNTDPGNTGTETRGQTGRFRVRKGMQPPGTSYSLDRLQPTSITAAYSGATLLSLSYSYCPLGSGTSCTTNNGNLLSQQIAATEPARSGVAAQSFRWDSCCTP